MTKGIEAYAHWWYISRSLYDDEAARNACVADFLDQLIEAAREDGYEQIEGAPSTVRFIDLAENPIEAETIREARRALQAAGEPTLDPDAPVNTFVVLMDIAVRKVKAW